MKRALYICITAMPFALLSCMKESGEEPEERREIVLHVDDKADLRVQTRATAVTSVPSTLYWAATTGSSGSESVKWTTASASVSGGNIATGKYQSVKPTTYNYYVSNGTFTAGTSATTMTVADNGTDLLSARVSSSLAAPTISLGHIFARTGSLTLNTQEGYVLSDVSWAIEGKGNVSGTAGVFNMTSDSWTSATVSLPSTAITSTSDLYLIPGEYTVKVSYTLSKGGAGEYSEQFTKSASVTLAKGKINNISGTAVGGNASGITLSVEVAAWEPNNISVTF